MTSDDINAISENRDYLDDIKLGSDEWDSDASKCSHIGGVNKKKRLYELLEDRKLRQELDEYDSYLECASYDDDVLTRYYSADSEDL